MVISQISDIHEYFLKMDAISMEIVVLELTLVGVAVSPGSLAGAMHAPGNKFPLVDTAINKGERTTSLNNAIAEVVQIDVTRAHAKGAATMGVFISKLPLESIATS